MAVETLTSTIDRGFTAVIGESGEEPAVRIYDVKVGSEGFKEPDFAEWVRWIPITPRTKPTTTQDIESGLPRALRGEFDEMVASVRTPKVPETDLQSIEWNGEVRYISNTPTSDNW